MPVSRRRKRKPAKRRLPRRHGGMDPLRQKEIKKILDKLQISPVKTRARLGPPLRIRKQAPGFRRFHITQPARRVPKKKLGSPKRVKQPKQPGYGYNGWMRRMGSRLRVVKM